MKANIVSTNEWKNDKSFKKKPKLRSFTNFYPTFLPLKHDILGGDASKFHEPINVSETFRAVNPSLKNLQVCRDASLSNFRDRSWQWRSAADPVKNGQSSGAVERLHKNVNSVVATKPGQWHEPWNLINA